MTSTVQLIIGDKTYTLPVIEGSQGEKAIDIGNLRRLTGHIALDPDLGNTGICKSAITYVDGEKGHLRYRGIPIEQLVEHSNFVETAFLLMNGELPTRDQLRRFSVMLNDQSLVHEDMKEFFKHFPARSNPMGILSSMVTALRSFYPGLKGMDEEEINVTLTRIISKVRTMAAMSYKISKGHRVVYPRQDYSYCANFLHMMFDNPVNPYEVNDDLVRALNIYWILHADHEQSCSTAAVRLVGSGRVNVYAAIAAGMAALWGPLHGGANLETVTMLEDIWKQGGDVHPVIAKIKDQNDPFRLMGFGNRMYRTMDPRARIMKELCVDLMQRLNRRDPLLDIALELEETALKDDYFIEHNLYPNIDFYSGIILRALGIPDHMFTVMYAIGRLPGWISQWKEDALDPRRRLYRPLQLYTGRPLTPYVPLDERTS